MDTMKSERDCPLKFSQLEMSVFYVKDGRYYGSARHQVLRFDDRQEHPSDILRFSIG